VFPTTAGAPVIAAKRISLAPVVCSLRFLMTTSSALVPLGRNLVSDRSGRVFRDFTQKLVNGVNLGHAFVLWGFVTLRHFDFPPNRIVVLGILLSRRLSQVLGTRSLPGTVWHV